jgi:hypothetical protein
MAQQTFEELVAAVKQAESRGKRYKDDGKTLTTSPKGALGEMQVMPKTITDPGFGVTPAKDKSPDEIARVGVDYLQAMKQKYGDTEKALIAYNWGPGSTDRWLASGADPKKLPAETRTYVERVKGFLGKDVPRETMAKKDREPLPPSLPPMAQAEPKTTTVASAGRNMPDIKNMPASYQAAFALAALADAKDDEKEFDENKETESEKLMREYKPVNHLASLDLSVTPVMMKDGGDVDAEEKRPDDINYFSNVNRMKDRGVTTDSVMLGARTKAGEGSVIAGLNMANMSKDEKMQTARALMLAYTQQDPEGLGFSANVVKPQGAPAMANLMGSLPVGEGRVSAGVHGNQAYSLGYNRPVEGGQFSADLNVPRGTMGSPQLNLRYDKRFAEGGDVSSVNRSFEEEEDVSKPYFGNPNISRQAGQARRNAAIQKANYGDELAEAKDTARKGEAYQELEKYLQSRGEMPSIKIGRYMPDGTHGVFFSDNANVTTGDIKINKNLHETYMPATIAHEVTHAADRQMKQQAIEQGMFGKSNQFTEAYKKMVGPEGRNRTQLLRKRYPEFEQDNRYYRSEPKEVAAHGIGAYSGIAMQDPAPRHVDATAATEFRILMDLAQRNVDKGPKGLEKIPAFFRKFGRYADGGPVYRAEGSPMTSERKLDRETIALMRGERMQPEAMTRVRPPLELNPSAAGLPGLMMYNDPSLPGTGTAGYVMVGDDNAKNPAMAQAMFLNPKDGNKADTIAHETEHLLARQNLGRGSNINTKFDELIGDNGLKRIQFVQKAVQVAPYLKEKYGLESAYFQPEMVEFQGRRAKNLLYEQLASLAALEQRHKIDLTKDPELRKTLFARPDVRETYNALTGLRQTRLDPRDLPPHTRVPEPGMLDAIKGVFKRADGGMVYRADGSPEEGERLTPQQIERIAAQESAEREALSTPAFIAQKSGIGRKAGPVSQALQSGQGQIEFLKGMTNVPQNILGAPMDISNMIANVYGGGVEKPFMGSEYLKEKSRAAGLGFKPSTDPTLAGFYGAGDLGSNLVNPAGVTRTGVKAAEKTGEAAKMLARDFQGYNQQLAVPGASYAIRNRGTPFLNTPEQFDHMGKVERGAMGEADDYANWLSRTFAHGQPALKTWLRDKVGAYLRRDFGTESDQMVQAADQGKKLHFMSPKLTENVPHQLGTDIGLSRELEGFPKAGFAKTPQGQKVEEVIDSTIYPLQLQDINSSGLSYKVPKSMQQFVDTNPEMRVSQMGPIDENLKLDELAQAMEKMFKEKEFKAYGETAPMPKEYILTEDTLKGLTPAQASNRVANKMAWVEKKRGELAGVAISKDPQIVSHSYDNGSKWISPADLADNPNHAEMVKDIGCAGGWCTDKANFALDYGSGENRLNILLDKKFEPRVQLTLNQPQPSVAEFAKYIYLTNNDSSVLDEMAKSAYGWHTAADAQIEAKVRAMPEYQQYVKEYRPEKSITEIKGQFNNADLKGSPYLKQIQDFIKRQGPDLQRVENLGGINMVDMRNTVDFSDYGVSRKNLSKEEFGAYTDLFNKKLVELNGNSYFVDKDRLPDLVKTVRETIPTNKARQIQMNLFGLPKEKAHGGMIERQPNDNRRYL